MIAVPPDSSAFIGAIDAAWPGDVSIVARYRRVFTFGRTDEDARFKLALAESSLEEGARVVRLLEHRGVDVWMLDESSRMRTGTLKSIDGCIAAAKCRMAGVTRAVFESGGNTGTALTVYGQQAGMETICVVPEASLPLLDSAVFGAEGAHLVAVADPAMVKPATHAIGRMDGIRHIPDVSWRYEAARFRGCVILEHSLAHGGFDWLVQTISAAFGPIGIYDVLRHFAPGPQAVPRFLGVQQAANCPMYSAWVAHREGRAPAPPRAVDGEDLLTRVMYDVAPQTYGTFEDLQGILAATRGELTTINHAEFAAFLDRRFDGRRVLALLDDHGVRIGTRGGDIVEKTGLIAFAGVVKAIDAGAIAAGSRVLCCLTSGTRPGDGLAEPDCRVSSLETLAEDCRRLLRR